MCSRDCLEVSDVVDMNTRKLNTGKEIRNTAALTAQENLIYHPPSCFDFKKRALAK